MKSEIVKLEAPELGAIEKSKAQQIKETFEPMVDLLSEFEDAYNSIITASNKEITPATTNAAKRLRLDIAKVRIQTGKLKDEGKAEYLRAERAIQAVHNIIVWAVTDKENKLKEIENHFELMEKQRLEKLQSDRAEKLSKYVEDADERDLSSMDEDVWKAYLGTKKQEYEDRIAAEKKAEEERIEAERKRELENKRYRILAPLSDFLELTNINLADISEDQFKKLQSQGEGKKKAFYAEKERIRKENERIKKEREEAEKKAEEERKAREEKQRKEQAAYEEKIRKERERRQQIEAEQKEKAEQEEAERQRIAEEQRKAELAPDKDKLLALAERIEQTQLPKVDSAEADKILNLAASALAHTARMIRKSVNETLK